MSVEEQEQIPPEPQPQNPVAPSEAEAPGRTEEDEAPSEDSGQDLPQITSREDLANILQALVFASPDVLTLKRIREIVGDFVDQRMVAEALQIANDNFNRVNAPFELVEHAGGFRFRTRKIYYPWVRKLFPELSARRLSQAALETLAVVAYKQPITRAELEAVRGVSCDGPLRNLLDKKLIALGERSEAVGNAYTYITTQEFLKYFGINRIPEDLPRLAEFEDLIEAGDLVPQYRKGQMVQEEQESYTPAKPDPNQVELSMGEP
ncbi:MAG TPA: SMC-Scp complex subunit ScpB [Fibrobacteraceae bacterium]|nr:SMC-Scp complex subunit ScpB [Fibrobacteraceae bacterium]